MTPFDYLLNLFLVGLVVLQVRGHKITRFRLLLPVVATAYAATQFLHAIPTAGDDLVLELALAATGAALGTVAGLATAVRRDGPGAFAKAGAVAAMLWIAGVGARMGFSLWVTHGGAPAVARFSAAHHITSSQAWVAAFILMALLEVLTRTAVLYLKTVRTGGVIPRGGLLQRTATA